MEMMAKKSFEEALADLVSEYIGREGPDAILSAFELQTMAINEERGEEN